MDDENIDSGHEPEPDPVVVKFIDDLDDRDDGTVDFATTAVTRSIAMRSVARDESDADGLLTIARMWINRAIKRAEEA